MASISISPAARRDLDSIWDFIAADEPKAADRFLDAVVEKCSQYARQPEMGELRSQLLPGIRQFPVGQYIVFYRAVQGGIDLVRVLHCARDIDQLL